VVPLEPFDRTTLGGTLDRRLNVQPAERLSWQVAADGRRVVYSASTHPNSQLFSIPLDPSASPVLLSGPLEPSLGFALSADGTQVAFVAERQGEDVPNVFRALTDGSQAPVQLNDPFQPSVSFPYQVSFSSDGSRVLYITFAPRPGAEELFSAPSDRSTSPVRLSSTPSSQYGQVSEFRFSPDGGRALYLANPNEEYQIGLFGVPADGSAPSTQLDDPEHDDAYVTSQYQISADGRQAYFVSNRESEPGFVSQFLLYGVPTDGSAAPRRLVNRNARRVVPTIQVSPDGARVAYLSTEVRPDQVDLFSVPTDGSRASVRLTIDQTLDAWVRDDFEITSDAERVVFLRSPSQVSSSNSLFSVPLTGGQAPVHLATSAEFEVSPDGRRVIYQVGAALNTIPVDGSQPALDFGLPVRSFLIGPASRFVYFFNDIDLYSAPIDASSSPTLLSNGIPPGTVASGLELSRGGAIYFVGPFRGIGRDLYGAAIDGIPGPRPLNPPFPATTEIRACAVSQSTGRVVFVADPDQDSTNELFSVRLNGSGSLIQLNPPLVSGGDVTGFELSPDGETAVYLADQDQDDVHELYAVPVLGGSAVRLSGDMTVGGDVTSFVLGPGRRVLYSADQDIPDTRELYSSAY